MTKTDFHTEVGDAHSVRSGQPQLAGSFSSPLCGAEPLKPLWWGPVVRALLVVIAQLVLLRLWWPW